MRESTGARTVGDGDRFERDEPGKYGARAGDAKWWELQSLDGSRLWRKNDIGYSTASRSNHWPTDWLQRLKGGGSGTSVGPTIIRHWFTGAVSVCGRRCVY